MSQSSFKVKIQKMGTTLSNMVMPNIGAFIAWGVLTSLFIPTGWTPNEHLSAMVGPAITYLLPLLIGYTGGHAVYGQRGAVVGAIATFGAIAGVTVPMFIGAMIMGPVGAWVIKKFDEQFQSKIPTGFEMLVNNFSAGLIGFGLIILSYLAVGPLVASLTTAIGNGVEAIVNAKLLPLANILVEPAKILFLNNAINHGIFTPLGAEQVAETGKSILYLVEANPGPGLGILLAYGLFGKGSAKSSSWGASIIHFFGGIHEIYFPYVMMKPAMFLAVIAGGVSGTLTLQTLGAGLSGAASPGSIIAILGMAAKGSHFPVIAGVLVGALVSFLVASIILKADNSSSDDFESKVAETKAAKAASKGQAVAAPVAQDINLNTISQIIFACDAGMGSSAMGASILRDKVKKAGLDLPVTNKAIANLEDTPNTLIVTQEELTPRAQQRTPRAIHVSVDNFLATPKYDDIIAQLTSEVSPRLEPAVQAVATAPSFERVQRVFFAHGVAKGSATMGRETLVETLAKAGISLEISTIQHSELASVDAQDSLVITNLDHETAVRAVVSQAQVLAVDSLVTTAAYKDLVAQLQA